jgi:AcrR family transcriptional regulator
MTPSASGTRYVRQVTDRRTTLLDATCRVIATSGMRGLRVEEVAREAGASTALIYYYFGSRSGLVRSALTHVNSRAEFFADVAEGTSGRRQLIDQLQGEFQDRPEVRQNSAVWGEVRGAAVFDETLRPLIREATDQWVSDLSDMIRAGHGDGSIVGATDPSEVAQRLTSLVEGLSGRWLSGLLSTADARRMIAAAVEAEVGASDVARR